MCKHSHGLRRTIGGTTITKKLILAAVVTAIAVTFAPTALIAKRMHKEKVAKCSVVGEMCTKKLDKVGKITGWANTRTCYPNGKMYLALFSCYTPSGTCPKKC
jgi:hypothetical protein